MVERFDKDRVSILISIIAWNVALYCLKLSDWSVISVCTYIYLAGLIGLKLGLHLQLLPVTIDRPSIDIEEMYEGINSFCEKAHSHLKGWSILVFAWGGVKLAVYGKVLGTRGILWVGVDFFLVQKAVRIYTGMELLATMLAVRKRVLSALFASCNSMLKKVRPETSSIS